jgi:hypothetical protein
MEMAVHEGSFGKQLDAMYECFADPTKAAAFAKEFKA